MQLFSVYKLRDNIPEELGELKADGGLFCITDFISSPRDGEPSFLTFRAYRGRDEAPGIITWYLKRHEFEEYFDLEITADDLRREVLADLQSKTKEA